MHLPTLLPLVSLALPFLATAWNTDIHNQIGFMAEKFLKPSTTAIVSKILTEPIYNGSIGRAAAWADSYRRLPEGAHTYQWHWIDSDDTPPAVCNTYYNRDCAKGGCIVSAIANQSQILRSCIQAAKTGSPLPIYSNNTSSNTTDLTCSHALKFLVHFTSDLAQPLHTSYLGEGGNAFSVSWGGRTNNSVLHSIWDGAIIYSLAEKTSVNGSFSTSTFSNQSIDPFFARTLVPRIQSDRFFTPTADWVACTDPATPVKCAMLWAEDSNRWNCDYVYSQDINAPDLLTSGYFEGAYPIVEIQMSKAALRLATYLNRLVAEDYDDEREVVLRTNPAWREWRKDEL